MSYTRKLSVFYAIVFIAIRSKSTVTRPVEHDIKKPNVIDGKFPGLNTEIFRLIILLAIQRSSIEV